VSDYSGDDGGDDYGYASKSGINHLTFLNFYDMSARILSRGEKKENHIS
jgi:hypothetical protein